MIQYFFSISIYLQPLRNTVTHQMKNKRLTDNLRTTLQKGDQCAFIINPGNARLFSVYSTKLK